MPKTDRFDMEYADIIAAIPSFNEQDNIGFVAKQISTGLKKYYPKHEVLLVNCDNGSTDNTKEEFLKVNTGVMNLVIETEKGKVGKGHALKMLFELSQKFNAKAVMTFDADLKSIRPEWVKIMTDPILKGYDLMTPYYSRYKYDGTITNNICYPLTYGLFCQDIRQPIGGDFAFSGRLVDYWLDKAFWPKNASLFGIDIFMTSSAVLGGFKVGQGSLGAKIHRVKDPALTLEPMFRQVISTLFKIIIKNKRSIKKLSKIKKSPIFGPKKQKEPQSFDVSLEKLNEKFLIGFREHYRTMKKSLSEENYSKIKLMAHTGRIHITSELFARVIYDYIIAYKRYERSSSTILKSLVPIWFGRTASFVDHTLSYNNKEAEEEIKEQAEVFYEMKNYLLKRL